MSLDPRARTKVWADTRLVAANITKADDATPCTIHVCYANPLYPLKLTFFGTKNNDVEFAIQDAQVKPVIGWDKKAAYYVEEVPIEIFCVDKGTTVLGLDSLWKAEAELRRIAEVYPLGSVRTFSTLEPNTRDMGGWNLYSKKCILRYKRASSNVATSPYVSYGDDWIYEGDTLTGGVGGTWDVTNHKGDAADSYAVNSDNNLVITTTTANDTYTHNGTAIALSSTTYTKIRWRYKTTGSATAKIIIEFSDASTQTVLSETAGSTWTTGSATVTTAKTINYVRLYGCDGAGTTTYDFVQIYMANYILPNTISMDQRFTSNDAYIGVPGRQGEVTQALGTQLLEVRMVHDTDVEATTLLWQRPQTTGASDTFNTQCIEELWHYGGDTVLWRWLNIGDKQFKARLEEIHTAYNGQDNLVECVWREYRHGGQETFAERFTVT
jgi:hypothetical protein